MTEIEQQYAGISERCKMYGVRSSAVQACSVGKSGVVAGAGRSDATLAHPAGRRLTLAAASSSQCQSVSVTSADRPDPRCDPVGRPLY